MFTRTIASGAVVLMWSSLLSGCAQPSRVEASFGDSVRHVVRAQIANPEAALNPDPEPVSSFDGIKGEQVLEAHRGDIAKPKEVSNEIIFNVGNK